MTTIRDLNIMNQIQNQKEKDIAMRDLMPLDPEGKKLAEGKRFTFDIIAIPSDPLR